MRLGVAPLLLAIACAQGGGGVTVVTGSVLYRERIALPPGVVVRVTLLDVSFVDAPARVIAEQEIWPTVPVPIPFAITVESDAIDTSRHYGVRATIHDADGRLLWASPQAVPVLTRGAPREVTIILQRVREARAPFQPERSSSPARETP